MLRKKTRIQKVEENKTFWMVFRGIFKTIGFILFFIFAIAVVFFVIVYSIF